MLKLKVSPLTASQIEFLRRWDAEDDDELRRSFHDPRPSPMTTIYARKFACTRCGGEAYEYLRAASAARLWHWGCFCWEVDCTVPIVNSFPFTPWTGWKTGRGYFVPLLRKRRAGITRLNIVVPEDTGGGLVWRRGIATFRTIIQAIIAKPRDVRRLGRLQMLKDIPSRGIEASLSSPTFLKPEVAPRKPQSQGTIENRHQYENTSDPLEFI